METVVSTKLSKEFNLLPVKNPKRYITFDDMQIAANIKRKTES